MIHYNHNTGKHRNIKLNKRRQHALEHYRHEERLANVRDLATRVIIIMTVGALLAGVYLIRTA